ncbi:MAG: hypothetical protein ACLGH0_05875, partial [Thermoanaerobaculia bacterium]
MQPLVLLAALLWTTSTEIESEALRPRIREDVRLAAPAVALGRDERGTVFAWSMSNGAGADRIYVSRGGTAKEIPLSAPSEHIMDAMYPALAPMNGRLLLVWIERSRNDSIARYVYCELDAALNPLEIRTLPTRAEGPPAISGNWILAARYGWRIENGQYVDLVPLGEHFSDVAVANGAPRFVAGFTVQEKFTCKSEPNCKAAGGPFNGYCYEHCRIYENSYRLRMATLIDDPVDVTHEFASQARPAVEAIGDETLIVWFHGDQNQGGGTVLAQRTSEQFTRHWPVSAPMRVLGSFGRDNGPTRPDIATDGERYFVVWRGRLLGSDHDIVGAILERDGTITEIPIATSVADERDPSVVAAGDGRFIVSYEKLENGERR